VNADDWQRSKDLFSAAVALAEPEREPFLESQSDSTEVLQEVRSLLGTYQQSSDFLDDSTPEPSAPDAPIPSREPGKKELLRRLQALLERESKAHGDSFPSGPAISAADNHDESAVTELESLPQHIGSYKILRRLGEGGMGVA